jgi:hypothetical protein
MEKTSLKLMLTHPYIIPIVVKVILLGLTIAKVLPLRGDPINADSF